MVFFWKHHVDQLRCLDKKPRDVTVSESTPQVTSSEAFYSPDTHEERKNELDKLLLSIQQHVSVGWAATSWISKKKRPSKTCLVSFLSECNLLAHHAKRVAIMDKMSLVERW